MVEREITDIGTLYETLGGLAESSRFFGVPLQVVWNWRYRGQIPTRLYFSHAESLKQRGIPVSKAMWGFRSEVAA